MANIVIWSVVESGIGIIAASLPPIHKLFKFYDDSLKGESTPAGAGAFETIGGTPLSQPQSAFELKPLRSPSRLNMTKSGKWDRLDDDALSPERITVRRTFSIVEENNAEEAEKVPVRNEKSGKAVIVPRL